MQNSSLLALHKGQRWLSRGTPMNILYTESFPNIGGQELQTIAQMNAMRRLRHQVTLACCEHKQDFGRGAPLGIPVVDYQTGIRGAVAGQKHCYML